jgi:hypothetical protein
VEEAEEEAEEEEDEEEEDEVDEEEEGEGEEEDNNINNNNNNNNNMYPVSMGRGRPMWIAGSGFTRGPAGPLEKALNGVTAYMRCPEMGTSSSCPECGSKMTRLRDTKGASKNASGRSVCCTNPDCGLREFKTLEDGTVVTDSKGKPVKWDHPLANRDHLAVLGIAFLFQCIVLQVEAPEAYRPRARDEILIDSNGVVKVKVNKEARKRAREANEANKKAKEAKKESKKKAREDQKKAKEAEKEAKKKAKEDEKEAKKKAKEDEKEAKKKAKEDQKKAKEDEKEAKKKAKEDQKKAKEDEKEATKKAKAAAGKDSKAAAAASGKDSKAAAAAASGKDSKAAAAAASGKDSKAAAAAASGKDSKAAAAASGKDSKAAVNAEAAGKDMSAKVTTVMSTRRRASVEGGVEKTQGTTGSKTPLVAPAPREGGGRGPSLRPTERVPVEPDHGPVQRKKVTRRP